MTTLQILQQNDIWYQTLRKKNPTKKDLFYFSILWSEFAFLKEHWDLSSYPTSLKSRVLYTVTPYLTQKFVHACYFIFITQIDAKSLKWNKNVHIIFVNFQALYSIKCLEYTIIYNVLGTFSEFYRNRH